MSGTAANSPTLLTPDISPLVVSRFFEAVVDGDNPTIIKYLDIHGRILLGEKRDTTGQTALMLASWLGQTATIGLLLERGSDVNLVDNLYGMSPLMWAASYQQHAVARLLLEKGADLELTDNKGRTALWYAKEGGQYGSAIQTQAVLQEWTDMRALQRQEEQQRQEKLQRQKEQEERKQRSTEQFQSRLEKLKHKKRAIKPL